MGDYELTCCRGNAVVGWSVRECPNWERDMCMRSKEKILSSKQSERKCNRKSRKSITSSKHTGRQYPMCTMMKFPHLWRTTHDWVVLLNIRAGSQSVSFARTSLNLFFMPFCSSRGSWHVHITSSQPHISRCIILFEHFFTIMQFLRQKKTITDDAFL